MSNMSSETIPTHHHPICSFTLAEHEINLPVSPFRNMLYTDYLAPANQVLSVEQAIATAEAAKEDIRQKRELLLQVIQVMNDQEISLERDIRAHKAMVSQSAIYRIPLEVLGQIFIYSRNASGFRFGVHNPIKLPMAFRLSHVCRRWRKAAILASNLWNQLWLTASRDWTRRRKGHHDLLSLSLQRSGIRPLYLKIDEVPGGVREDRDERRVFYRDYDDDGSEEDDEDDDWVEDWIEDQLPMPLLEDHATRVTHLRLSLEPDSYVWGVLEHGVQFPSLVSLSITGSGPGPAFHNYFQMPTQIFSASTSLNNLSLAEDVDDTIIDLPVENLTHLDIKGSTISSCHRILAQAVNIRELVWTYDSDGYDGFQTGFITMHNPSSRPRKALSPGSEVILPNVRRLITQHIPIQQLQSELSICRFPQLEVVSGLDIRAFTAQSEFITTNSLTVLGLIYYDIAYQAEDKLSHQVKKLFAILPSTAPNLKYFNISCAVKQGLWANSGRGDPGFSTLIELMMDQDQHGFDSLEFLSLGVMTLPSVNESLLRMVRLPTGLKKLKGMTLVFLKSTPQDKLLKFTRQIKRACKQTGLRVTIKLEN